MIDINHKLWMGRWGLSTAHVISLDLGNLMKSWVAVSLPLDALLQCLRLHTHMEWFTRLCQTYTKWLTYIICCVRADGASVILSPQHMLAQIWESWVAALVPLDVVLQWLRLHTDMEWSPHLCQAYLMWLTSLICCGRADGASVMLLPLHMLAQTCEIWISPTASMG